MILVRSEWERARTGLEDLFTASFGKQIGEGYLDWRYRDNPSDEILFSIEMATGQYAASYSAFPAFVESGHRLYKTAVSMTTMTHPSYRGKGLFPKLAEELYRHAERRGFGAVWGFPNANSHSVFVGKLGWRDIYEIPTLSLDLASARVGAPQLGVVRDDGFALSYPEFKDDLIRVNRSSAFLRWRYAKNPLNRYANYVVASTGNVTSYAVTKAFGNDLDVVDFQPGSPADATMLLNHIVAEAKVDGRGVVRCWAPPHHYVHALLERVGFENQGPVTYFGAKVLSPSTVPKDFDNYRSWYIQMGDSDVY